MRDIIFHSQWCAALAMVSVDWPGFACTSYFIILMCTISHSNADPILAQTAWATLSYSRPNPLIIVRKSSNIFVTDISITQGLDHTFEHWDPLGSQQPYNPPSNFIDQFNDRNSPLFIDPNIPNTLFTLPDTAVDGISSFAATVGLRPQDLFGVCLSVFLAIICGTVVLSFIVWLIDWVALLMTGGSTNGGVQGPRLGGTRTPPFVSSSKDGLDGLGNTEESRSLSGQIIFRATSRLPTSRKSWWKSRPDFGSFHGSTLVGNLVRILVLFHFPVTIFSCYQFTLGRANATLTSIVLAAFSFAIISVLLPVLLVVRLTTTSTNKLYDETRTLLALGPLYNHYRHGSQLFACLLFATNIAFGVTIGCGQKSGTAQAIIILIIEVVSALVTSIWLPWGQGASMGLISFLFCVARIVIAVLLVILTPTVSSKYTAHHEFSLMYFLSQISIGNGAGGWVAYGILIILGLVYLAFVLMLIVKLIEALARILGGIGFDRSKHVVDSGLLGTCGMLGCCGGRKSRRSTRRRYRATEVPRDTVSEISSYLPPAAGLGQKEATPSHHSQPASVLRPEHALRPYREDSDDESGYIMGAWQPFPRPGYNAVEEPGSPVQAHPNPSATSGFSRVGGGRATFDTPYAIATGSALTFPSGHSTTNGAPASATLPPSFHDDDEEEMELPPTASVANIARQPQQAHSDLPPGAMSPHHHIRTKSQTAIVEDFNPAAALYLTPPVGDKSRRASSSAVVEDGADATQPKKKHWYQIRKNRRHSEGDALEREEEEPVATTPTPGKSFVVIRDRKPQSSSPRPATANTEASGSDGAGTETPKERPTSFVVLRGNNNGEGRNSS